MTIGKKAVRNLCIILGTLLLVMFVLWGLSTSWGKTKIQRVHTVAANGETYSCVMFVPKTATTDTPAPAVLLTGGGDNNAYRQLYYAVEYARRGYVVLSLDQQGYGESDTPDMTAKNPTEHYYDYLIHCCDFVQTAKIIVHAFSYGGMMTTAMVENTGLDNIPLIITSVSARSFIGTNVVTVRMGADMHTDDATLWSQIQEMYENAGIMSLDEIPDDMVVGSFEDRTGLVLVTQKGGTHTQSEYSRIALTAAMKYADMAVQAPIQRDANDILLYPLIILNLFAMVAFYLCIPCIANVLLQNIPFFTDMITSRPVMMPGTKMKWWISAALALCIPAAIFDPIFQKVFFSSGYLPLNVFKVWMAVCALISMVIFAIDYVLNRHKNVQSFLRNYGLSTEENPQKLPWKTIGKAFVLSCFTICLAYSLIRILNMFTGLNITFLFTEVEPVTKGRLLKAWTILIPVIMFIITTTVDQLVTRRLPELKSERFTLIRDVLVNGLIGCGGVLFVVLWYCIAWKNGIAQPWANGGVSYLYSMPVFMFVVSMITTYMYRKTGTIWASLFTGGLYMIISTIMSWR